MYEIELRKMRRAVRANKVRFTSHSLDELEAEGYGKADAFNCILTGEIVEDQMTRVSAR